MEQEEENENNLGQNNSLPSSPQKIFLISVRNYNLSIIHREAHYMVDSFDSGIQ
jgi:hypothetical protein